jgi:hypothetical protein
VTDIWYKTTIVDGVEFAVALAESGYGWARHLQGAPLGDQWVPPRVRYVRIDERGLALRHADLPWLTHQTLALNARAIDALRPELDRWGELLPLDTGGDERLWVLNVSAIVQALDSESSNIVRFRDGRIMDIPKFVLRRDAVRDLDLFRLAEWPSVFVSKRLLDRVEAAGLVGLGGREVPTS